MKTKLITLFLVLITPFLAVAQEHVIVDSATLIAGSANIGSVLGKSTVITSAQTVTATPYEAGDLVGAKISLTNAADTATGSGVVQSVVITDLAMQAGDYDVVFFSSDPTGTTFTDEAALDIADADLPKVVCVVPVTVSASFADNGVSYANGAGCAFDLGAGSTTLYAAIVVRSTPTFVGTSDVQLRVGILQD